MSGSHQVIILCYILFRDYSSIADLIGGGEALREKKRKRGVSE